MARIEVTVDTDRGTLDARGNMRDDEETRFVFVGRADLASESGRFRVVVAGDVVAEKVGIDEDGDDAVAVVPAFGNRCRRGIPSQDGAVFVLDHEDGAFDECRGRGILLRNWLDSEESGIRPPAPSGAVPITDVSELPSRYRESDMRNKLNEIVRIVSGRAVLFAAMLCPFASMSAGVSVYKATKGDIWNDEQVVTNVVFDAGGLVTSLAPASNYVDSVAADAMSYIDSLVGESSRAATNYTDSVRSGLEAEISSAAESAVADAKAYTDLATNSIVIPEYDLSSYAQKTWVEGRGYLVSDDLEQYATRSWVNGQGFVPASVLNNYATMSWVGGQGFVKSYDLATYATKAWVDGRGFATEQFVDEKIFEVARAAADTNGVTRVWTEDGATMMDATGVVWDVTWTFKTNWTSLSNGVRYVETMPGFCIGDGVITNKAGNIGAGAIVYPFGAGKAAFYIDGFASAKETLDMSGLYISKDGDWTNMRPDAFTGTVEKVATLTYRNRFAWITEAGGGGNKPFEGQTFDFSDNRVLYTALSNIVIQLGGSVVNFPDFQ